MAHRYSGSRDKDDDDYDYSDSFISDEDDESVKKHTTTRKVAQVTARKKPPPHRGPKGRISSRATSQSHEPKVDNAVQRMLSSKNLRINELKNQIEDFRIKMEEMREENKLLRKTQKRQEKALNKFENEESDLPQLLQRHNNEVRTLREQLKKTQDKYQRTDRYLRDAEDELEKTKSKMKKYKNLVEDKDLLERQDLQKKLQQAEIDLEERDVKVRDLEKHITHLNKNHRHELGIEIARHRDLQRQIEGMRKDNDDLQTQLKEKVKAAELANIYSLRKGKKLPASYSGTPNRTPPPMNARKRHPSLHDLTPREKVKMYEDKRKEEEKLHRERGDGPKMAFQTTGSNNRVIHKSSPKKQLTYRAPPKTDSDNREYYGDNTYNRNDLNSSEDRRDHQGSSYITDPHGYNTSQEINKSSEQGVFSKPRMFGSKNKDQSYDQKPRQYDNDVFYKPMNRQRDTNPYQSVYDKKKDPHSDSVFSKPPLHRRGDNSRFDQKKQRASRQKEKITASSTFLTESHEYYPSQPSSDQSPKNQERQKREREEQQRQRAEEEERRRQREREEQEMRELEQLEVTRRQREAREREEQRKRDQEAEDWMKKMENEKRQREAEEQRVREEQQRKEREERDRRERERQEQERRAREEKDRMAMDSQLAEERMKKDELLRKLRMIDEGQNKTEEKKSSGGELFFATSSKARRDSEGSATSSKKSSYSFTKPVENMHHGKPAREDVTVPYIERQKKQQAESPVSGYQPSFGLSSGITGTNKKTTRKSGGQVIFGDFEKEDKTVNKSTNKKGDLMAELFGNSSSKPTRTTELDNDDIFKPPVRNTKTNATKTSGFPWEDDKKSTTTSHRGERASSLFGGGGSGILDDNEPSVFDSSKLLPKRGKQTSTTFQTKPVVSAIDHMDDDIEEVIL